MTLVASHPIADDIQAAQLVGEKQMSEEKGAIIFLPNYSLTKSCPETESLPGIADSPGNNTNVRLAPQELCTVYGSIVTVDADPTEEQWLDLTAPVNAVLEEQQEIQDTPVQEQPVEKRKSHDKPGKLKLIQNLN